MRVLATWLAVVLGVALPALADDLDDASKLLKAGQRDQALRAEHKRGVNAGKRWIEKIAYEGAS